MPYKTIIFNKPQKCLEETVVISINHVVPPMPSLKLASPPNHLRD